MVVGGLDFWLKLVIRIVDFIEWDSFLEVRVVKREELVIVRVRKVGVYFKGEGVRVKETVEFLRVGVIKDNRRIWIREGRLEKKRRVLRNDCYKRGVRWNRRIKAGFRKSSWRMEWKWEKD